MTVNLLRATQYTGSVAGFRSLAWASHIGLKIILIFQLHFDDFDVSVQEKSINFIPR